MAELEDFGEAGKFKERMKRAYENGYHFEWIGQSHMFLETLLKSYLYIHAGHVPVRKMKKGQVDWIKRLTFSNVLNILDISGLLSEELFYDLKKVNEARNQILHNLVLENEKLEPLVLDAHYELCQKAVTQLSIELLNYVKVQSISEQIFYDVMKDLEERRTKRDSDNVTKN